MKNLLSESELNDIKKLCIKFELSNYKINSDGTVDVHGDVDLSNKNLEWLPINFNIVVGNFNVSYNKLYDFHNFPKEVKGDLSVFENNFRSLDSFDMKVG